jgi:hypothetical protein
MAVQLKPRSVPEVALTARLLARAVVDAWDTAVAVEVETGRGFAEETGVHPGWLFVQILTVSWAKDTEESATSAAPARRVFFMAAINSR